MQFNLWFVIAGALLIGMALAHTLVKRLPLTTSFLYLLAGIALGPSWLGMITLSPVRDAELLERVTEIAVIVSLFTAGLKLRTPLRDALWKPPLRLAFVSMTLTVGMVALVGTLGLGLPLGAAILLGAVLAPTDPVLASDVQVEHAEDRDRLRFGLTGEAGFNDGTAFPFVMLGLGLLGLHDIGEGGWRWVAVDVVWAIIGGLGIGALLGTLVGRLVVYLRREHKESVGLDDFLALGLIALSYGAALLAHAYGFLAVFAAGLALRAVERRLSESTGRGREQEQMTEEQPDKAPAGSEDSEDSEEAATHPEKAPEVMAQSVLAFNEQVERIAEVAVVLLVGGMISLRGLPPESWWFVPLMFLVIRPVAVLLGLLGARVNRQQRGLMAWFGIRGIGSLYYLAYAIAHGVPDELASRLSGLTLAVIATSIVVHGISVTPLMNFYARPRGES
jgi:NhaP-type Na+/H+ or K+/H+ antiporter